MNINIFSKYKVKYTNKYSYISDKIGDEYIFSDGKAEWTKEMDGYELIKFIINLLKDRDFMSINSIPNGIGIEHFDPSSGEPASIKIEYEEILEEGSKNECNRI